MSTRTTERSYTIKEAAALTGLPASTLRYYESIGVISPVSRGASSGHRVYDEGDLDQLMWVACLAATGMSVSDMRQYVANGRLGPAAASEQVELLAAQERRLALEVEQVALRRRYVQLKISYWHAIEAGDTERADLVSTEARSLADELKRTKNKGEQRSMRINAYATPAAGAPLAPTTIERRDVGSNDVLIEIQYAGICHSDIHTVNGDWGPQPFPVVPGHEIVGLVTEVGPEVTRHQVGDRVGVGCMVNSCGDCTNCRNGDEQYCLKGMVGTYAATDRDGTSTQGGYSTHVVVDADFVLSVPAGIDSAEAAPLLCAGITTYAPLRKWGVGPGTKVAVVGLGGLGHMGVKIAHAMGAEVTVLSQSLKKLEDGLRLGADHYFATSDPDTFKHLAGSFDLIINTVSAKIDVDAYLGLLGVDGTLVNVGAPAEPLSLNVFSLITGGRSFAGSMIGGIALTQEMLDFCAEHNIGSEVEIIAAEKINEAYERVLASDVRYRFVIDVSTIG